MSDSPPRLDTSAPGPQSGYAPIAWTAVGSLALAGLFALILAVVGFLSFRRGEAMLSEQLLILPAVAVVLAFIARRQILTAEGTRAGLGYADAGWWIGVVGGLGFVAYLLAVDLGVRTDAQKAFATFADKLKGVNPADPKDRSLYEACYLTLAPGERGQVTSPSDIPGMDQAFGQELVRFRQLDAVRIASRNPGQVEFTPTGMRDWTQAPTQIDCTLTYSLTSPEGEHGLVVPMKAKVDNARRTWQVAVDPAGYVKTRKLTRYGWLIDHIENTGRQFAGELVYLMGAGEEQRKAAFEGYVRTDGDPAAARKMIEYNTAVARMSAAGGPAYAAPTPRGFVDAVRDPQFFTLFDGAPATPEQRARFVNLWTAGRVQNPGGQTRESADQNPVMRLEKDAVILRVPVELTLGGRDSARGRLVLRAADPQLVAELDKGRAAGGPTTPTPPPDVTRPVAWRLVRVESDLKPLPTRPEPPPGG